MKRQADLWTLRKFQQASHSHLNGAQSVLEKYTTPPRNKPALMPATAVYLTHVALECGMKARLLRKTGCNTVSEFCKKQPILYGKLFHSKIGHDINELSVGVNVQSLYRTDGKTWKNDTCWKRIIKRERPYTLRYGAEAVTVTVANEEITRVSELLDVLFLGIR